MRARGWRDGKEARVSVNGGLVSVPADGPDRGVCVCVHTEMHGLKLRCMPLRGICVCAGRF